MNVQGSIRNMDEKERGLVDLIRGWVGSILANWWIVALSTAIALAAASIYLRVATYVYSAEIKVTASQSESSGLPGNLGSLAAAAGVSLPRGAASSFPLYVELLKSRAVAERLIKNDADMRKVFPDDWPDASGKLPPPGPLSGAATLAKSVLGVPIRPPAAPSAADLEKYLDDTLSVSENPKRGVSTIRFEHEDPVFAGAFLQSIHEASDSLVRERTVARATASVSYIQRRLQGDLLTEHRMALAEVLGEQERSLMMARSGLPYAADMLGGVAVSNRPTSPRPVIVLAFALAAGLGVGLALAILRPGRERS